jgi:hypothetical protein
MDKRKFQRIFYTVEVYKKDKNSLDGFSTRWWKHRQGESSSKTFRTMKRAFNVAHSLSIEGCKVVLCRFIFNRKKRRRKMTEWTFKPR